MDLNFDQAVSALTARRDEYNLQPFFHSPRPAWTRFTTATRSCRLGCPGPGVEADLFFLDELLTHFEREEDIHNHRGKLEDDLVQVREVLGRPTSNSIVILNEIFTSTTLRDALILARRVLDRLIQLTFCACA